MRISSTTIDNKFVDNNSVVSDNDPITFQQFCWKEVSLKRALGNWVVGDRFWDRETELALFMEYLEAGANVLLTAPRRIGKTSLMREAARRLEDRFICLQVDLQKAHSPADAIVQLSIATKPYLSLWGKTTALFGEVMNRIATKIESVKLDEITLTLRSGITSGDWQAKGDRFFEVLAESEKPVIVFLDEVPILINRLIQGPEYRPTNESRQVTDAFMSWLRDNTIRHQGKVRIVVTGSIGLEPILRFAGLNATLNTFTSFPLGAWSPETSINLLYELAKEYGLTLEAGSADRMVQRIGYCIPHHVQVYFDNVYQACRLKHIHHVSPSFVDEVYESRMLSIQGHAELSHMEDRLKVVLGPDLYPFALELFTEVTVAGALTADSADIISAGYIFEGRVTRDVLREVLGILEHDGYVRRDDQGDYRPQSKLVNDWWKARFGFGYTAALKRRG
jgi:hypothetical protein